MKIRVINGPNLNMLGIRQPELYGSENYAYLVEKLQDHAEKRSKENNCEISVETLQSNTEGQLIDWVQQYRYYDALIINFGAYSHTSIALMDALLSIRGFGKYIVEVHISNIHQREEFRRTSFSAAASDAVISGCKTNGYLLAIDQILEVLSNR